MSVESDICQVTESIFSSMGLSVERCESAPSNGKNGCLTGCIQITGNWKGTITLDCSIDMARQATAMMFGMEPAEAGLEEMRDVVGELVNMIGGNLKARLPQPSQISLPSVTEGNDYQLCVPGSHTLVQVAFRCGDQTLRVSLMEGNESEE